MNHGAEPALSRVDGPATKDWELRVRPANSQTSFGSDLGHPRCILVSRTCSASEKDCRHSSNMLSHHADNWNAQSTTIRTISRADISLISPSNGKACLQRPPSESRSKLYPKMRSHSGSAHRSPKCKRELKSHAIEVEWGIVRREAVPANVEWDTCDRGSANACSGNLGNTATIQSESSPLIGTTPRKFRDIHHIRRTERSLSRNTLKAILRRISSLKGAPACQWIVKTIGGTLPVLKQNVSTSPLNIPQSKGRERLRIALVTSSRKMGRVYQQWKREVQHHFSAFRVQTKLQERQARCASRIGDGRRMSSNHIERIRTLSTLRANNWRKTRMLQNRIRVMARTGLQRGGGVAVTIFSVVLRNSKSHCPDKVLKDPAHERFTGRVERTHDCSTGVVECYPISVPRKPPLSAHLELTESWGNNQYRGLSVDTLSVPRVFDNCGSRAILSSGEYSDNLAREVMRRPGLRQSQIAGETRLFQPLSCHGAETAEAVKESPPSHASRDASQAQPQPDTDRNPVHTTVAVIENESPQAGNQRDQTLASNRDNACEARSDSARSSSRKDFEHVLKAWQSKEMQVVAQRKRDHGIAREQAQMYTQRLMQVSNKSRREEGAAELSEAQAEEAELPLDQSMRDRHEQKSEIIQEQGGRSSLEGSQFDSEHSHVDQSLTNPFSPSPCGVAESTVSQGPPQISSRASEVSGTPTTNHADARAGKLELGRSKATMEKSMENEHKGSIRGAWRVLPTKWEVFGLFLGALFVYVLIFLCTQGAPRALLLLFCCLFGLRIRFGGSASKGGGSYTALWLLLLQLLVILSLCIISLTKQVQSPDQLAKQLEESQLYSADIRITGTLLLVVLGFASFVAGFLILGHLGFNSFYSFAFQPLELCLFGVGEVRSFNLGVLLASALCLCLVGYARCGGLMIFLSLVIGGGRLIIANLSKGELFNDEGLFRPRRIRTFLVGMVTQLGGLSGMLAVLCSQPLKEEDFLLQRFSRGVLAVSFLATLSEFLFVIIQAIAFKLSLNLASPGQRAAILVAGGYFDEPAAQVHIAGRHDVHYDSESCSYSSTEMFIAGGNAPVARTHRSEWTSAGVSREAGKIKRFASKAFWVRKLLTVKVPLPKAIRDQQRLEKSLQELQLRSVAPAFLWSEPNKAPKSKAPLLLPLFSRDFAREASCALDVAAVQRLQTLAIAPLLPKDQLCRAAKGPVHEPQAAHCFSLPFDCQQHPGQLSVIAESVDTAMPTAKQQTSNRIPSDLPEAAKNLPASSLDVSQFENNPILVATRKRDMSDEVPAAQSTILGLQEKLQGPKGDKQPHSSGSLKRRRSSSLKRRSHSSRQSSRGSHRGVKEAADEGFEGDDQDKAAAAAAVTSGGTAASAVHAGEREGVQLDPKETEQADALVKQAEEAVVQGPNKNAVDPQRTGKDFAGEDSEKVLLRNLSQLLLRLQQEQPQLLQAAPLFFKRLREEEGEKLLIEVLQQNPACKEDLLSLHRICSGSPEEFPLDLQVTAVLQFFRTVEREQKPEDKHRHQEEEQRQRQEKEQQGHEQEAQQQVEREKQLDKHDENHGQPQHDVEHQDQDEIQQAARQQQDDKQPEEAKQQVAEKEQQQAEQGGQLQHCELEGQQHIEKQGQQNPHADDQHEKLLRHLEEPQEPRREEQQLAKGDLDTGDSDGLLGESSGAAAADSDSPNTAQPKSVLEKEIPLEDGNQCEAAAAEVASVTEETAKHPAAPSASLGESSDGTAADSDSPNTAQPKSVLEKEIPLEDGNQREAAAAEVTSATKEAAKHPAAPLVSHMSTAAAATRPEEAKDDQNPKHECEESFTQANSKEFKSAPQKFGEERANGSAPDAEEARAPAMTVAKAHPVATAASAAEADQAGVSVANVRESPFRGSSEESLRASCAFLSPTEAESDETMSPLGSRGSLVGPVGAPLITEEEAEQIQEILLHNVAEQQQAVAWGSSSLFLPPMSRSNLDGLLTEAEKVKAQPEAGPFSDNEDEAEAVFSVFLSRRGGGTEGRTPRSASASPRMQTNRSQGLSLSQTLPPSLSRRNCSPTPVQLQNQNYGGMRPLPLRQAEEWSDEGEFSGGAISSTRPSMQSTRPSVNSSWVGPATSAGGRPAATSSWTPSPHQGMPQVSLLQQRRAAVAGYSEVGAPTSFRASQVRRPASSSSSISNYAENMDLVDRGSWQDPQSAFSASSPARSPATALGTEIPLLRRCSGSRAPEPRAAMAYREYPLPQIPEIGSSSLESMGSRNFQQRHHYPCSPSAAMSLEQQRPVVASQPTRGRSSSRPAEWLIKDLTPTARRSSSTIQKPRVKRDMRSRSEARAVEIGDRESLHSLNKISNNSNFRAHEGPNRRDQETQSFLGRRGLSLTREYRQRDRELQESFERLKEREKQQQQQQQKQQQLMMLQSRFVSTADRIEGSQQLPKQRQETSRTSPSQRSASQQVLPSEYADYSCQKSIADGSVDGCLRSSLSMKNSHPYRPQEQQQQRLAEEEETVGKLLQGQEPPLSLLQQRQQQLALLQQQQQQFLSKLRMQRRAETGSVLQELAQDKRTNGRGQAECGDFLFSAVAMHVELSPRQKEERRQCPALTPEAEESAAVATSVAAGRQLKERHGDWRLPGVSVEPLEIRNSSVHSALLVGGKRFPKTPEGRQKPRESSPVLRVFGLSGEAEMCIRDPDLDILAHRCPSSAPAAAARNDMHGDNEAEAEPRCLFEFNLEQDPKSSESSSIGNTRSSAGFATVTPLIANDFGAYTPRNTPDMERRPSPAKPSLGAAVPRGAPEGCVGKSLTVDAAVEADLPSDTPVPEVFYLGYDDTDSDAGEAADNQSQQQCDNRSAKTDAVPRISNSSSSNDVKDPHGATGVFFLPQEVEQEDQEWLDDAHAAAEGRQQIAEAAAAAAAAASAARAAAAAATTAELMSEACTASRLKKAIESLQKQENGPCSPSSDPLTPPVAAKRRSSGGAVYDDSIRALSEQTREKTASSGGTLSSRDGEASGAPIPRGPLERSGCFIDSLPPSPLSRDCRCSLRESEAAAVAAQQQLRTRLQPSDVRQRSTGVVRRGRPTSLVSTPRETKATGSPQGNGVLGNNASLGNGPLAASSRDVSGEAWAHCPLDDLPPLSPQMVDRYYMSERRGSAATTGFSCWGADGDPSCNYGGPRRGRSLSKRKSRIDFSGAPAAAKALAVKLKERLKPFLSGQESTESPQEGQLGPSCADSPTPAPLSYHGQHSIPLAGPASPRLSRQGDRHAGDLSELPTLVRARQQRDINRSQRPRFDQQRLV